MNSFLSGDKIPQKNVRINGFEGMLNVCRCYTLK